MSSMATHLCRPFPSGVSSTESSIAAIEDSIEDIRRRACAVITQDGDHHISVARDQAPHELRPFGIIPDRLPPQVGPRDAYRQAHQGNDKLLP